MISTAACALTRFEHCYILLSSIHEEEKLEATTRSSSSTNRSWNQQLYTIEANLIVPLAVDLDNDDVESLCRISNQSIIYPSSNASSPSLLDTVIASSSSFKSWTLRRLHHLGLVSAARDQKEGVLTVCCQPLNLQGKNGGVLVLIGKTKDQADNLAQLDSLSWIKQLLNFVVHFKRHDRYDGRIDQRLADFQLQVNERNATISNIDKFLRKHALSNAIQEINHFSPKLSYHRNIEEIVRSALKMIFDSQNDELVVRVTNSSISMKDLKQPHMIQGLDTNIYYSLSRSDHEDEDDGRSVELQGIIYRRSSDNFLSISFTIIALDSSEYVFDEVLLKIKLTTLMNLIDSAILRYEGIIDMQNALDQKSSDLESMIDRQHDALSFQDHERKELIERHESKLLKLKEYYSQSMQAKTKDLEFYQEMVQAFKRWDDALNSYQPISSEYVSSQELLQYAADTMMKTVAVKLSHGGEYHVQIGEIQHLTKNQIALHWLAGAMSSSDDLVLGEHDLNPIRLAWDRKKAILSCGELWSRDLVIDCIHAYNDSHQQIEHCDDFMIISDLQTPKPMIVTIVDELGSLPLAVVIEVDPNRATVDASTDAISLLLHSCNLISFKLQHFVSSTSHQQKTKLKYKSAQLALVMITLNYKTLRKSLLRQSFSIWLKNARSIRQRQLETEDMIQREDHHKQTIAKFEQTVADWSEIIKGLNGASSLGLSLGVRGLWAHACPTLMSMLTSRVKVEELGLIIMQGDQRLIEFIVKDFSTPVKARDHEDGLDLAYQGNLDIRFAEDLGSEHLVESITKLFRQYEDHNASNKILISSVLNKTSIGHEESLSEISMPGQEVWMIPLRTARSVIGVLRVRLNDNHASPRENLETCLLHFADILAPLLAAAKCIDAYRSSSTELERDLTRGKEEQEILVKELESTAQTNAIFIGLMSSLKLETQPRTMTDFAEKLSLLLSKALGLESKVILDSGATTVMTRNQSNKMAAVLSDASGNRFGEIIVHLKGEEEEQPAATARSLLYQLSMSDRLASADESRAQKLSAIMQPAARLISALLLYNYDMIELAQRSDEIEGRLQQMDNLLQQQSELISDYQLRLSEKTGQQTMLTANNQRIDTAVNDAMIFLSQVLSFDNVSDIYASLEMQIISISRILADIVNQILEDEDYIEERICIAYVAIDRSGDGEGYQGLSWYDSSGPTIHPSYRSIADSLAATCYQIRSSSIIDVNHADLNPAVVDSPLPQPQLRIITHPIATLTSTDKLSLLQLIVINSSDQVIDYSEEVMKRVLENIERISQLLGGFLTAYHQQRSSHAKMKQLADDLVAFDRYRVDHELNLLRLQHDTDLWHNRVSLLTAIQSQCSRIKHEDYGLTIDAIVSILRSEDIQAQLHGTGFSLTITTQQANTKASGRVEGEHETWILLPKDAQIDYLLSIRSIDTLSIGTSDSEAEAVKMLATVIKSMALLSMQHQERLVKDSQRILSLHQKYDKIKVEARELKAKSKLETAKSSSQSHSHFQPSASADDNSLMLIDCFQQLDNIEPFFAQSSMIIGPSSSSAESSAVDHQSIAWHGLLSMLETSISDYLHLDAASVYVSVLSPISSNNTLVIQVLDKSSSFTTATASSSEAMRDLYEGKRGLVTQLSSMQEDESLMLGVPSARLQSLSTIPHTIICIPLMPSTGSYSFRAPVLRVILAKPSIDSISYKLFAGVYVKGLSYALQRIWMRLMLTDAISSSQKHQLDHEKQVIELKDSLSRCRKIYRVVCREASILMDSPLTSLQELIGSADDAQIINHPAGLPTAIALQDVCLKILTIHRTLLRSEGQAILLLDTSTNPRSYQVIYTGSGLRWPGIAQGVFGAAIERAADGLSLTAAVCKTHKPLVVLDPASDARYHAQVDGFCEHGCPMLLLPLRGQGGSVIGVMILVKGQHGHQFSSEDIVVAEMIVSIGGISLYWCEGIALLRDQQILS
jgi:hypothetical protein